MHIDVVSPKKKKVNIKGFCQPNFKYHCTIATVRINKFMPLPAGAGGWTDSARLIFNRARFRIAACNMSLCVLSKQWLQIEYIVFEDTFKISTYSVCLKLLYHATTAAFRVKKAMPKETILDNLKRENQERMCRFCWYRFGLGLLNVNGRPQICLEDGLPKTCANKKIKKACPIEAARLA